MTGLSSSSDTIARSARLSPAGGVALAGIELSRPLSADDKAAIGGIGEHAERDLPQPFEVEHDNCKNGAELDQDRKALPEIIFPEIEEAFREQQMPGRRHRQKFRDALDNAENDRPYRV